MFDKIKEFINPKKNPDLTQAHEYQCNHLPTLWLLGKTGAGKSSLIQTITGESSVDIGNGFEPCTQTSEKYEFPRDKPLIRFIDTRGLAEADYDPSEDIEALKKTSHALIVIMKADDHEQSSVLSAIKNIKKQGDINHLLLVHTGMFLCDEKEREITANEEQLRKVWGNDFTSVPVDFELEDGSVYNYEELIEKLSEVLPFISLLVNEKAHSTVEEKNFNEVKNEVLWFASTAAGTDLFPAVGLVSVPAIQGLMLSRLANQYGVDWNMRVFSEFTGTLGSSFALQYASKLGLRQLAKFIPYYGQTVAAAAAAAITSATTYGLARVACFYFYKKSKNEPVSEKDLQDLYKEALRKGKKGSGYEKNRKSA